MSDTAIALLGLTLALALMVPFFLMLRRRERVAAEAHERAVRHGLDEPATLHPIVDPDLCMGSGTCIAVCPEEHVLGIRNGQAVAIAPAKCVGHGLCERSCPVNAIRLVFGTATRGVEIPRVREDYETNVTGLYIVGELGGMGLIRNAFEQGRQCVQGIAAHGSQPGDAYDVAIVGCGPAGLAASLHCLDRGLRFVTLEKEDVGGTVRYYPRKKLVMTSAVKVPGYGKLNFREVEKERLIEVWHDIIEQSGLRVNTEEPVARVQRTAAGFAVESSVATYHAHRVILAIGRRGIPRKLGVPGEASPHVAYSLLEPEAYQGDRIVVVGGGDSAVEAALALAEQPGNTVRLSYRRDKLGRIKERNRERFDDAVHAGRIEPLWSTQLTAIEPGLVRYHDAAGSDASLPTDRVFVFIGGELPTAFLKECGIEFDTHFGAA